MPNVLNDADGTPTNDTAGAPITLEPEAEVAGPVVDLDPGPTADADGEDLDTLHVLALHRQRNSIGKIAATLGIAKARTWQILHDAGKLGTK